MKKTIIIILTALITVPVFSQTYVPFPKTNATWNVYRESKMEGYSKNISVIKYTLTGADTTINYTKYKSLTEVNTGFVGGIREQDKKIYFCFGEGGIEYILYDFNAQVGDTIKHDTNYYNYDVVLAIDSIQIDGNYRKRFEISNSYTDHNPDYIIEGIGSAKNSLIYAVRLIPTCICFDYWEHICFEENGVEKYLNPNFSDCNSTLPIAGDVKEQNADVISVFPNPIHNSISIKIDKTYKSISVELMDAKGAIIYSKCSLENSINVSSSTKGLYFLRLVIDNETVVKKVIIE